jgi:hypothetical protein
MRIGIASTERAAVAVGVRADSTGNYAEKSCRHTAHVGTCAACQRAQLTRWQVQLSQVAEIRERRLIARA